MLIIDDLERCAIPFNILLGYINSFIEQQGLKVIIIANEKEIECIEKDLYSNNKLYRKVKEKLIGKTLQVQHDVEQACICFISKINDEQTKDFLTNNKDIIIEIFNTAKYFNLRHLKQCLWDYEHFYQNIPKIYRNNSDLMKELLLYFFAFSFEIKSGKIVPEDIKNLSSVVMRKIGPKSNKENSPSPIVEILKKYPFIDVFGMILTEQSWRNLFSNGYLSENCLQESLAKSKYCQNKNTPVWVKLWHYLDLEDDEFTSLYSKILSLLDKKKIIEPGEILHVCGLFLNFSREGLIDKKIDEILSDLKRYIDNLKDSGKFIKDKTNQIKPEYFDTDQWGGLGYFGKDLEEFKEISIYLSQKVNEARIKNLPNAGKKLLKILKEDTNKFTRMIYLNNSNESLYYETPIFAYVNPKDFFKIFLNLTNRQKMKVIHSMDKRYNTCSFIKKISNEVNFLEEFSFLLTKEVKNKEGLLSGHILKSINENHLVKIIEKINR